MMKRLLASVVVTILLTLPAVGQSKSTDPEKAANIHELLNILGAEKLQQGMMDQFMTALKPMLAGPVKDNEKAERVLSRLMAIMREEFKATDMTAATAALYDKYFTSDEIKGLLAFYQSPVGQKAAQILPALTQEAMKNGMQLGQQIAQKSLKRLVEEFPELKSSLKPPQGL